MMIQTRPARACLYFLSHAWILFVLLLQEDVRCDVVFLPSFLVVSGPRASAFLVGNVTNVTVSINSVSPSNATGSLPPASCVSSGVSQWTVSKEHMGMDQSLLVRIILNRGLQLCTSKNETNCCAQPLCVRETVMVCACLGNVTQAMLIVQAQVYAQLLPSGPVSENKTVIPNQVFQPLGQCPCDLTAKVCDIRCCCDQDCTPELLWLFAGNCLPGPFGGMISPVPDYVCSAQSTTNAPDWFPFLCVTSPSENNPFLGLFYDGTIVTPKPAPSFQTQQVAAPLPSTKYRQGVPILTTDNKYFTIPQVSMLGQCLEKAPVAFLHNFEAVCVRTLLSCPTALAGLGVAVRDEQGGVVKVSIMDELVTDLIPFLSSPTNPAEPQFCPNVVLSLSYKFEWKGNGITAISVTRRIGNITVSPGVTLTTRYSAVFVNGNTSAQPNSGNPGYQVGRPVIGGVLLNATGAIERAPISLWQGVSNGLCSSADLRPVLYGINSTSGCLMPVSLLNLTECSQLRETVRSSLAALVPATLVSRSGNPDFSTLTNWTRMTIQSSNQTAAGTGGVCSGIPAHLHIHIRSIVMGTIGGIPQKMIQAVELNFKVSTWSLQCGAAQGTICMTPDLTQTFPVTSSVTFTEAPINTQSPMSRFSINFTEFDCDRNDVCWPELAFPLTPYYTGEPYSQALAKGLILVFFFIAASVLGTPWRQIRQAWSNSSL
ncbi:tectonic-2 isoform X2 [Silurus meridionalis]|uniref:tectonic-2 isoform X2 n=1 Tax=Silurus meridionalis TaxID=175797 RepID=UPI001EEC2F25|nr:tectonic-2 isoform X2 [Silurus meridionalis]XP_046697369.1 tectonic-2 isoform X2 [Silurus meridionalis]